MIHGVSETTMELNIGSNETLEGLEVTYYPSDNKNHIPFMWGMDMDKYIEKNKNEQISLRNFCLSSINKEDKKREVKKKI